MPQCIKCDGLGNHGTCNRCRGSGNDGGGPSTCISCHGSGIEDCVWCSGTGSLSDEDHKWNDNFHNYHDCSRCGGDGKIEKVSCEPPFASYYVDCPNCDGKGRIPN